MTIRPRGRGAFTLIELLVAMSLGVVLIGVITFIWMQSSKIFQSSSNNLESYQRLRVTLDNIERDLANTGRTVDMEFFVEGAGPNGHFDDTDLLLKSGTEDPPIGVSSPANSFRAPNDPRDPLVVGGKSEFLAGPFAGIPALSDRPYIYAPVVYSPDPYTITTSGHLEGRAYWRDEFYTRTFIVADGVTRPAIVHYRLVQDASGRSALRRRAWYQNGKGQVIPVNGANPGTDRTSILATGMCDLKFAFFLKQSATNSAEGEWYHVGYKGTDPTAQALLHQDEDRGFKPALGSPTSPAISAQHADPTHLGGANAVAFYYEGVGRIENVFGLPVLMRTISDIGDAAPTDSSPNLDKYKNFDFPGVRPGDKVYLYDATEDDGDVVGARAAGPRFPDQVLTIDEIPSASGSSGQSYVGIKFRETINFFQLARYWLGTEPEHDIDDSALTGAAKPAGPARRLSGSFNVKYRVGFLPPAIMVRLSVDDPINKRVHVLERVIRLLQH
jgi:type II secretory pathway pseudopilin PulG